MSAQVQRRRFTVDEYYAMAGAGILSEDDRVELIEGEIVQMAAIGSRHAACVDRLTRMLVQQTGARAHVRVQNPVRLSEVDEPRPDVAMLRPREDFYAAGHPGAGDTLLIIEVADSTLGYDRVVKLPRYARAGVPEVWIVNLDASEVEVYQDPAEGRYRASERVGRGGLLSPERPPEVAIATDDILGQAT